MTLIEAVAAGWWYAAPIPGGRLVVTLFTDPDLLAAADAWRGDAWWRLLRPTGLVWERVARSGCQRPSRIETCAAGSSLLPRPWGAGWIAAGDAAAAFDPLSSHGIGSALAAGEAAARAVAATLTGEETACARYGDSLLADYAYYLWLRHAYYAAEQRWPSAPFWARRHNGLGLVSADLAEAGRSAASLSPRH